MKAKRKNLIKLKIDSINTFVLLNTYNDRETFEYDYISGNRCITINSIFNNSISFGLNLDSTDEEKEYTARLHNIKTYNRLIKRIKEIESYRKSKENDNLLNYLNNEVCRAFNEWFNKKGINYKIFIGYDVFDKLDEIIWEYIDDYVKNENYFRTIEFFNGTETERYDKLMEYKANLHDRIYNTYYEKHLGSPLKKIHPVGWHKIIIEPDGFPTLKNQLLKGEDISWIYDIEKLKRDIKEILYMVLPVLNSVGKKSTKTKNKPKQIDRLKQLAEEHELTKGGTVNSKTVNLFLRTLQKEKLTNSNRPETIRKQLQRLGYSQEKV